MDAGVILKRFEAPDEVRELVLGRVRDRADRRPDDRARDLRARLEVVGARRPDVGATRRSVGHVGLVLAGTATAAFDDGTIVALRAGELFAIPAIPHDS